jgi:hypothetical protein
VDRRVPTTLIVVGILGAVVVLGALLVGRDSGGSGSDPGATGPPGRVYAVDRGDPVTVTLETDGERCISIEGDPYLSSTYCPPTATIRSGRAYTVASPIEGAGPVLVIGFLPAGRSRAAVTAGSAQAPADVRPPLFLASLPSSALGPEGDEPVTVDFG